ncbi:hypothetical protein ABI59_01445 [Acidobacteria bacterium Mor1]|nr:hypothetical protein ABI59_01445 [Acidobacteria bacterium Mor1]
MSRGVAYAELLVALALSTLLWLTVLTLFDRMQRLHRAAGRTAEVQWAARAAMDHLRAELRLAGLGVRAARGGDEVLEFAGPTAVVFRGDLDGDRPESRVPEDLLSAGGAVPVPVGNDEIVGYVLSADGPRGPDLLSFSADVVPGQRDGRDDPVEVDRVDLGQSAPPYTLYRVHVDNDPARYGSRGFIRRTPVIDHVVRFRLRYRDALGRELDMTAVGGEESAAARARRDAVRSVELELVVSHARGGGRRVRIRSSVSPRGLAFPGGVAR